MTSFDASKIISSLKTPASQGTAVTVAQVVPRLDRELQKAGELLKAIILASVQVGHRNNITAPRSDFAQATEVELDTQGLRIDLPTYAENIDQGRKRGTYPPFADILAWVLKYRIQGRGGARKASSVQLAHAIQRSIFKNGVKPRPFLDDVNRIADDLMAKVIDEVILPNLVQPLDSVFT